jgi:hypothetical protein
MIEKLKMGNDLFSQAAYNYAVQCPGSARRAMVIYNTSIRKALHVGPVYLLSRSLPTLVCAPAITDGLKGYSGEIFDYFPCSTPITDMYTLS